MENPFVHPNEAFAGNVNDVYCYLQRSQECDNIVEQINRETRLLYVSGPPWCGKTVLLHQVRKRLLDQEQDALWIRVDFSNHFVAEESNLQSEQYVNELHLDIREALRQDGLSVNAPAPFRSYVKDKNVFWEETFVPAFSERRKVILVWDGFQEVMAALMMQPHPLLNLDFFLYLFYPRRYFSKCDLHLMVVDWFPSTRRRSDLAEHGKDEIDKDWDQEVRSAVDLTISPVIDVPSFLSQSDLRWSKYAIEMIQKWTGGQPYLANMMAWQVVNTFLSRSGSLPYELSLQSNHLRTGVRYARRFWRRYRKYLRLSGQEISKLKHVARVTKEAGENSYFSGVPWPTNSPEVSSLIKKGVLKRGPSAQVQFLIPYLIQVLYVEDEV